MTSYSRADRQQLVDAGDDPFQALLRLHLRVSWPGEDPADRPRPSQPPRDADQLGLALHRPLPQVGVGVGEVGRAAEHGHRKPRFAERLAHAIEIVVVEAGEEAVVHLQAVGVERAGHRDPVEDRHGAMAGDLFEITLGECGKLQSHGSDPRLPVPQSPSGTNFTQTALGTSTFCPVGWSCPDCGSIRKTTTVPESWFAASK